MRILLIEDDKMIGESLSHALKNSGYAVDWARDGDIGEESLKPRQPLQALRQVLLEMDGQCVTFAL